MIVNLNTVVPDKLVCADGLRRQELVDTPTIPHTGSINMTEFLVAAEYL
jgi:hypothetical protein